MGTSVMKAGSPALGRTSTVVSLAANGILIENDETGMLTAGGGHYQIFPTEMLSALPHVTSCLKATRLRAAFRFAGMPTAECG